VSAVAVGLYVRVDTPPVVNRMPAPAPSPIPLRSLPPPKTREPRTDGSIVGAVATARREQKHTTWEQFQFAQAKEGNAATARRRRKGVVLRPPNGEVRAHKDCMQSRQGMSALMPQQTGPRAVVWRESKAKKDAKLRATS
jgi:hypothetical protein